MIKSKSTFKGFTIVELLIVVVVIAILSAVTIVAYRGITNQANDSAMKAAARNFTSTVLTNQAANGSTFTLVTPYTSDDTLMGNVIQFPREEFLTRNNLQGLSAKLCLANYDQTPANPCFPPILEGEIPQYDKSKLYLSYQRFALDMVSVSFHRWSNQKQRWIGATWISGFDQENSGEPYNLTPYPDENNQTSHYRCAPEPMGNSWDFDSDCRYFPD